VNKFTLAADSYTDYILYNTKYKLDNLDIATVILHRIKTAH